MLAAAITVGFNVNTEPMSVDRVEEFRSALARVIAKHFAGTWAQSDYDGSWENSEGRAIPERAHIIFGPLSEGVDVQELRNDLKAVRAEFKQEAAGLLVGESELI